MVPWRREWLPTPVFLPGEFHGQRSLVGYIPWGRKELDTAEGLTHTHTHTHTQYARTERYSHYASLTHPGHFPACWVLLLDIKWGQPGFGSVYFLFVLGRSGSDWTPRLGVVRGTVKKRPKLYKGTVLSPLNLISQFPERKKKKLTWLLSRNCCSFIPVWMINQVPEILTNQSENVLKFN